MYKMGIYDPIRPKTKYLLLGILLIYMLYIFLMSGGASPTEWSTRRMLIGISPNIMAPVGLLILAGFIYAVRKKKISLKEAGLEPKRTIWSIIIIGVVSAAALLLPDQHLQIANLPQTSALFLHVLGAEIILRVVLIKLIVNVLKNGNWGTAIAALISGIVYTLAVYDPSVLNTPIPAIEIVLVEFLLSSSLLILLFADILMFTYISQTPIFGLLISVLFILLAVMWLVSPQSRVVKLE